MWKTIILAWNSWVDIDAYACIIALEEIYQLQNKEVYIFIPKDKSASITKYLETLEFRAKIIKNIEEEDKLILVDVSNKDYLENTCKYKLNNIVKIYDHHFESTNFWKEKIWENAVIENIWACASLIVKLAIKNKVFDKLSYNSKLLLFSAIISHTFNLKYKEIICKKDIEAYSLLYKDLNIDNTFISKYFFDVSKEVYKNPFESLKNDYKIIPLKDKNISICQMELWNQNNFIKDNIEHIISIINTWKSDYRFYMWIDIENWNTFFISDNEKSKNFLKSILWINFNWNIWIYEKIIIRKELIKIIKQI